MSENQLNQVSEKSESKFTSGKDSNSGLSASLWEEIGRMKQSSGAGATVDGSGLQHAADKVPSQDGGTKPDATEGNSNDNRNSDNSSKVPRDGGVKEPVGEKSTDADVAGKKMIPDDVDSMVKPVKPNDSFDNGIKPVKPNMEDGIVKPGIKKPPIKTEGPVCDKDSLQGYLEFAPLKFN